MIVGLHGGGELSAVEAPYLSVQRIHILTV